MAAEKIKFPVVYVKNTNAENAGYGKYYPFANRPETLTLDGFLKRLAFDQSVFTPDIVKGVIMKLTQVMSEQLQGGQPIKWDGLGTFMPGIIATRGGTTKANILAKKVKIDTLIQGVEIQFMPENIKGMKLTSRALKDECVFQLDGVKHIEKVTAGDPPVVVNRYDTIVSMEQFRTWGGEVPPENP